MGWLQRSNDRITEQQLRMSWRTALLVASVMAVVSGVVVALFFLVISSDWLVGATIGFGSALFGVLFPRVLILSEARHGKH